MAMDTTEGGPDTDSYAAVSMADAYHSTRGNNSEWSGADEETKERHLKWATRLIDAQFKFKGRKATREQARQWPRVDALDADGYNIEGIPREVRDAAAEYAFRLLQEDWTEGQGSMISEGLKIGPITTSAETHNPIPASVLIILAPVGRPLTAPGIRSTPLERA